MISRSEVFKAVFGIVLGIATSASSARAMTYDELGAWLGARVQEGVYTGSTPLGLPCKVAFSRVSDPGRDAEYLDVYAEKPKKVKWITDEEIVEVYDRIPLRGDAPVERFTRYELSEHEFVATYRPMRESPGLHNLPTSALRIKFHRGRISRVTLHNGLLGPFGVIDWRVGKVDCAIPR